MNVLLEYFKYLLPIIGVLLGASLQFVFSKKSESNKQRHMLKTKAYSDYLKAIAGIAVHQSSNDKILLVENRILLAEAKTRIVVYGASSVINRIAEFERASPVLDNPISQKKFMLIAMEIRKEGLESSIDMNDISRLLIGLDLNK